MRPSTTGTPSRRAIDFAPPATGSSTHDAGILRGRSTTAVLIPGGGSRWGKGSACWAVFVVSVVVWVVVSVAVSVVVLGEKKTLVGLGG